MNYSPFKNILNEVQIWWLEYDKLLNDIKYFYRILNNKEKAYANRYKTNASRSHYVISRGVLKKLISIYEIINPEEVIFSYNRYGKLQLDKNFHTSDLHFNISHSENLGVIGFKKALSLGIDIEMIKILPNLDEVANFCLSDFEKSQFDSIPNEFRSRMFYNIWTAKEAFCKAIGMGLSFPLKDIELRFNNIGDLKIYKLNRKDLSLINWRLHRFTTLPNYTGSLVTDDNDAVIRQYYWRPDFNYAN